MKNVLVYSLYQQGYQEACQLQAAKDHIEEGDNVMYLTCSQTCGCCSYNRQVNGTVCKICNNYQKKRAAKYLGSNAVIRSLNDYLTKDIENLANNISLEYSNVSELRKLKYEGVEIGYGVMSSYISWTRNMNPVLDDEFRSYIDYLLRMEVRLIEIVKTIIKDFEPDLIVFHNGRYAHYKPVYGLALVNGIDYLCTETVTSYNGKVQKDDFVNSIPHDAEMCCSKHKSFWNNYSDLSERDAVGRMFFENKRHSKYAGDTIYTLGQKEGSLPNDIDNNKEKIVIFNSSEDEFAAVGSIVEKGILFNDQYEAIKLIVEHYKNDESKQFILRVHPNLKKVRYEYHHKLYTLKYPNLKIIDANSDVSSYALMDIADKVLVFGSSMGIESSYWGKPVLLLRFSIYRDLDVVYTPKTQEEMWQLLDTRDLPAKDQQNAMKFGLYYMSDKHTPFNICNLERKYVSLFGKKYLVSNFYHVLGSRRLFAFCDSLIQNLNAKLPVLCRFKKIPQE